MSLQPHPRDDYAEALLLDALALADDIRGDLAAAHRRIRHMDRGRLEGLACVLAALVPTDLPVTQLAWWRHTDPPVRDVPECGTRAGYRRHKARGDYACQPCVEANRKYDVDRKREASAARKAA